MARYARTIVALLTLLAGCSVAASSGAGAATPSRSSDPGASIAGRLGQRAVKAPKFSGDFADPFVLQVGPTFYAYATNTGRRNVPFGSARIGRPAQLDGDALPTLPAWSEPGHVWAPAVAPNGAGYRLYYATRDRASGRQCISVAAADSPSGPFADRSEAPLVCQLAIGGSIDPSPIDVGGAHYLMWKNDGNCCGAPTRIWIAPLTADGLRVAAQPVALLGADQPWEHGLVEGPSMIEDGGTFYLFYSANAWDSASYATGYAVCATVTGPCHKPGSGPWLSSGGTIFGPGGGSAVRTRRGLDLFVFAAWSDGKVGYDAGGSRRLVVRPLRFVDGVPVLGDLGR